VVADMRERRRVMAMRPSNPVSKSNSLALLLVAALGLCLLPSFATAAPPPPPATPPATPPPPPPPATPEELSKALSDEGKILFAEEKYKAAIVKFKKAFATFPKAALLYNIAKCHERLAEYEEAVKRLEEYIFFFRNQNGTDPPDIKDVEQQIRVLKQRAFESLPTVKVVSEPDGATVAVGDPNKVIGSTPLTTHMKPGTYKVYVTKTAYVPYEREFLVPESGEVRLDVALQKIVKVGGLRVWVNLRNAQIYVDGKVVAVSPYREVLTVDPGPHQIVVQRERYGTITDSVDVPESKIVNLAYVMRVKEKRSSWRSPVAWTGAVLGALSLGGGFTASRFANKEFRDTPYFNELVGYQNLGYGIGSGVLAVAAGLFVWEGVREDIDTDDLIEGGVPPAQLQKFEDMPKTGPGATPKTPGAGRGGAR